MERERSCYGGGQFNGGRMIMLIWSVSWRENSNVMEVASLMEGAGSCYIGGQFNGYVTEVVTLMKGEWSCYRNCQFMEGE